MSGNYSPLWQELQRVLVATMADDRWFYYHSANPPLLSRKVELFEVI